MNEGLIWFSALHAEIIADRKKMMEWLNKITKTSVCPEW